MRKGGTDSYRLLETEKTKDEDGETTKSLRIVMILSPFTFHALRKQRVRHKHPLLAWNVRVSPTKSLEILQCEPIKVALNSQSVLGWPRRLYKVEPTPAV